MLLLRVNTGGNTNAGTFNIQGKNGASELRGKSFICQNAFQMTGDKKRMWSILEMKSVEKTTF